MYKNLLKKECGCKYRTYRLILMDLSMPVMDGDIAAAIILKSMPK
jgi:CheY-like chemotaxis protein